jgi:hypothetical protein
MMRREGCFTLRSDDHRVDGSAQLNGGVGAHCRDVVTSVSRPAKKLFTEDAESVKQSDCSVHHIHFRLGSVR